MIGFILLANSKLNAVKPNPVPSYHVLLVHLQYLVTQTTDRVRIFLLEFGNRH